MNQINTEMSNEMTQMLSESSARIKRFSRCINAAAMLVRYVFSTINIPTKAIAVVLFLCCGASFAEIIKFTVPQIGPAAFLATNGDNKIYINNTSTFQLDTVDRRGSGVNVQITASGKYNDNVACYSSYYISTGGVGKLFCGASPALIALQPSSYSVGSLGGSGPCTNSWREKFAGSKTG